MGEIKMEIQINEVRKKEASGDSHDRF